MRQPQTCLHYMTKHTPEQLEQLRRETVGYFNQVPALAYDLNRGINGEIHRRVWNEQNTAEAPIEADEGFTLNLDRWSDRDLADGLLIATGMSYDAKDTLIGELADALVKSLTREAALRLRETADPMSAQHFGYRLSPKEQSDFLQMNGVRPDDHASSN